MDFIRIFDCFDSILKVKTLYNISLLNINKNKVKNIDLIQTQVSKQAYSIALSSQLWERDPEPRNLRSEKNPRL